MVHVVVIHKHRIQDQPQAAEAIVHIWVVQVKELTELIIGIVLALIHVQNRAVVVRQPLQDAQNIVEEKRVVVKNQVDVLLVVAKLVNEMLQLADVNQMVGEVGLIGQITTHVQQAMQTQVKYNVKHYIVKIKTMNYIHSFLIQ
jgi:hypothetical protein